MIIKENFLIFIENNDWIKLLKNRRNFFSQKHLFFNYRDVTIKFNLLFYKYILENHNNCLMLLYYVQLYIVNYILN